MNSLKIKHIDLYQTFFEKAPISRDQEKRIATVLLPVMLTVAIASIWGLLRFDIFHLNQRIAPMQTYLNTVDTQLLHQKADKLRSDADALAQLAKTMKAVEAAADSYPHLEKPMLEAVYSLAEEDVSVTALAYDGNSGVLHISVETKLPESGQAYLEKLRKSKYFTVLEHTGYESNKSGLIVDTSVYKEEIFAMLPSPVSAEVES